MHESNEAELIMNWISIWIECLEVGNVCANNLNASTFQHSRALSRPTWCTLNLAFRCHWASCCAILNHFHHYSRFHMKQIMSQLSCHEHFSYQTCLHPVLWICVILSRSVEIYRHYLLHVLRHIFRTGTATRQKICSLWFQSNLTQLLRWWMFLIHLAFV